MSILPSDTTEALYQDAGLMVSAQLPEISQNEVAQWVQIGDRLIQAVTVHNDQLDLVRAVVAIVADCVAPIATLYLLRNDSQEGFLPGKCVQGSLEEVDTSLETLLTLSQLACSRGQVVNAPLGANRQWYAYALPVTTPQGKPEVLTAIVSSAVAADTTVVRLLELAAVHIAWWHSRRESLVAEYEVAATAALQELLEQAESSRSLKQACQLLASQLQSHVGCHQVAVALRTRGGGRNHLQAISGVESFDRHTPLATAMESALDEAVIREQWTVWPPLAAGDRRATLAHQKLCEVSGVPYVVSSPLRDAKGETVGAWLFLGTPQNLGALRVQNFLQAAETRVATSLSLLQRAEGGCFSAGCRKLFAHRKSAKVGVGLLALSVLAGVMVFPADYRIGCDCRIEPVSRRFAAAPYDGILEETLVTPGATVVRGDALARMDGREIRFALVTARAERDHAVKQCDSAFANHKFAAAEIAQLEIDRLESKIRMLEQRQQNLVVKSPIDGVVTSGDLDQAQGAPVTRGQTLFEIAPLNTMVVEVAVPEREVPYVQVGQNVVMRLESRPSARYQGTIKEIHPRAEIRDRGNVFIAQVILPNPQGDLRPGMQGTAKIRGPRRTMGWNLFHKPWESLCMMCGW